MESTPEPVDRDKTTPFLLKLYYRTGAFHRPDEFTSQTDVPPHITLHTWPTATLGELTHLLAASTSPSTSSSTTTPPLLPSPAIGTRLAFRHLYHDLRAGAGARLASQDLGSVVIGAGGPGVAAAADPTTSPSATDASAPADDNNDDDAAKTLADARFVVGDILSVAILPPSAVDGSVAPAGAARVGRGFGVGSGLADAAGNGRPLGTGGRSGFSGGGGGPLPLGGRWAERDRDREGRGAAPPLGEWRRGERLPDAPSVRGRGRGRPRW